MSDTERWGTRDLTYSNWHRVESIQRFLTMDDAKRLTMIDLDGLEYCKRCRECVGVIEAAQDVGQTFKPSIVTRKLAIRLGVPGLLIFWRPTEARNGDHPDIDRFRVQLIAPEFQPERELTPQQFALWLVRLHDRCACLTTP